MKPSSICQDQRYILSNYSGAGRGGEEIKPVPCSKIGNKTCTWCFFTNFDAKIRHFEHFGKIIWSPHGKLQGKAPNPNPNPKTSICTVKQTAVTVQLAAARCTGKHVLR